MLRKMSKLLVFIVAVATISLIAPNRASAVCDPGFDCNDAPNGTCSPLEVSNGWCGESVGEDGTTPTDWVVEAVTDTKGNFPVAFSAGDVGNPCVSKGTTIDCRVFQYKIFAPEDGLNHSLSQANILIPGQIQDQICSQPLQLLMKDNSVQIRTHDPNTSISLQDTTTDVVTWNALKLALNQEDIAIWTTLAGAKKTSMELVADDQNHYVTILGPDCCSDAHVETRRSFFTLTGAEPTIVEYDICTGEPSSGGPTTGGYQIVEAAYICPDVLEFDSKVCTQIKKIATRAGGLINVCIEGTNYVYFGHGNRIYRAATGVCGVLAAASVPTFEGPCEQEVVFDGKFVVRYPSCGFDPDDPPPGGDLTPRGCVIGPFADCDNFDDFTPFEELIKLDMTMCSTDDTQGKITYECGLITDGGSGLGVPISNKWYYINGRWVWR